MQFKIKQKEKQEMTEEIELTLRQHGSSVYLFGKDKTGRSKFMMHFSKGRFERIISSQLDGLDTDSAGQIIEKL